MALKKPNTTTTDIYQ